MALCSFYFCIESRKGKEVAQEKFEELIARNCPIAEMNSNSTNDSVLELSSSPTSNSNSEPSSTKTSSVTLVKFDVKDDVKSTNSMTKKRMAMNMSSNFVQNNSINSHNPKRSGFFCCNTHLKMQKTVKECLLISYRR